MPSMNIDTGYFFNIIDGINFDTLKFLQDKKPSYKSAFRDGITFVRQTLLKALENDNFSDLESVKQDLVKLKKYLEEVEKEKKELQNKIGHLKAMNGEDDDDDREKKFS